MVYGGVKRPDGAVSVRNGSDFVGKMGESIFCSGKYLFEIN
uniref:Uncharacterized protein n=1 Tax=Neisseria meningitidis alpha153 TaxID=663926 RepID=C6SB76_NEIME|nr:hypothetical protein predicted by Glimmer/Critica [Neisseria meningitidis alpha153]